MKRTDPLAAPPATVGTRRGVRFRNPRTRFGLNLSRVEGAAEAKDSVAVPGDQVSFPHG